MVIPDDSMRPIEAMQKIGGAISRKDIRAVDVIVGKESVLTSESNNLLLKEQFSEMG